MSKVFYVDAVTGRAAIYDGPSDAPFDNPLGHLGSIYFHSDLDYVSGLDKRTGSLTIPRRNWQNVPYQGIEWFEHVLFAHGRPGAPFCVGRVVGFQGYDLPLVGSVPLQECLWNTNDAVGGRGGSWQFIHLATDETNVMIVESVANNAQDEGPADLIPAVTINWEVVVTDKVLT